MKYVKLLLLFIVVLLITSCSIKKEYAPVSVDPCADSENKFGCIVVKGIEESNPNYCEFLSEDKDKCYQILGIRVKDYSICDKITNNEDAKDCKIIISIDQKNMEMCQRQAYEDNEANWEAGKITKFMCELYIKGQVKVGKDIITSESLIEDCLELVKEEDDEEAKRNKLNNCYFSAALDSGDLSVCDSISGDMIYYCWARVLARSEE